MQTREECDASHHVQEWIKDGEIHPPRGKKDHGDQRRQLDERGPFAQGSRGDINLRICEMRNCGSQHQHQVTAGY